MEGNSIYLYSYCAIAGAASVYHIIVFIMCNLWDTKNQLLLGGRVMIYLGIAALGNMMLVIYNIPIIYKDMNIVSILIIGCYFNAVYSVIQICKLLYYQSEQRILKTTIFSFVKRMRKRFWLMQALVNMIPYIILLILLYVLIYTLDRDSVKLAITLVIDAFVIYFGFFQLYLTSQYKIHKGEEDSQKKMYLFQFSLSIVIILKNIIGACWQVVCQALILAKFDSKKVFFIGFGLDCFFVTMSVIESTVVVLIGI